ncbi:MAG TPA: 3-dehydroquinate synthase [Gemmatimonadales bacterium]|jgi:3-dehydroquinate synthase
MVDASPVIVAHSRGRYPVYIEPGVLGRLETVSAEHLGAGQVVMIADATVHGLLQEGKLRRPAWKGDAVTFPAGEDSKNRKEWARITDLLLERRVGRDGGVIALGGGVAGDLAGFVAATYLRGIPFLQAPTSLLAMVDASVGGKTGVDTRQGKNLVGAFHHPAAVVADPRVLQTLPERDYRGGLAEAVKHGLIADEAYFAWMEREVAALARRDEAVLTRLVRRSVEIKAAIVTEDEREAGKRAVLNAGHTVAHALEQVTGYMLPHGEAVSLGLVAECALAESEGIARADMRERVVSLLRSLGLPVRLPQRVDFDAVFAAMGRDKKNRMARIHFALPSAIGCMKEAGGWTRPAAEAAIESALESIS